MNILPSVDLSNCFFTASRGSHCSLENCCGLEALLRLGDQILKGVAFAKGQWSVLGDGTHKKPCEGQKEEWNPRLLYGPGMSEHLPDAG